MTINGGQLMVGETMRVDGSAETNGNFRMFGGADADILTGGAGNDTLYGGLGADTLTGGLGLDIFQYRSVAESTPAGRDGIQDFTLGDKIDLSRIDANTLLAGDQAFTFIGSGAFTNHAGELNAVNTAGNIWTAPGDVDGDGVADFQLIVLVTDAHPLTGADFML